jgi:uncharacterized peroxidase-related enzyme
MFIETVPPDDATGAVAEIYEADRAAFGHLPNLTRAFSLRPGVYEAWKALNASVKGGMELRRYELATVAAARELQSSYCMLAHGQILSDRFEGVDATVALAGGAKPEGEVDAAVMDLAAKVAEDATAVRQEDVDRLRGLGLSDAEILDVVLTAAMRAFFSKVLDGVGALADARFGELEPRLRDALTVGRPIDSSD